MGPDTVKAVQDAVRPLAEKIGEGAEFLYSVYYKQTIIEGWLKIIVPLIMGVTLFFVAKYWVRFCQKQEKESSDYDKDGWKAAAWVPTITLTAILLIIGTIEMTSGVLRVANPHFYTIDRIIHSVQEKEVQ